MCRTHSASRPLLGKLIAFTLLLYALGVPRTTELQRFVTPDETKWLERSANFYQALAEGDFANTYQMGHPGVTVTWAGAIGFFWRFRTYVDTDPGQRDQTQRFLRYLERYEIEPIQLLAACRLIVSASSLLSLALAFLLAARLLGWFPALLGFTLIALDPFAVALSRLLQPDTLLSPLVLLALLGMLNYLYKGRKTSHLALSAAASGLSWLTKSPALFLAPFFALLVLIELLAARRGDQALWPALRRQIIPLAGWFGLAALVFTLFWPAMWVQPLQTLQAVFAQATGYMAEGHSTPLFYNGQVYPEGIPDWHFYAVNYLWRSTPSALVGLLLAGIAAAFSRQMALPPTQRRAVFALALFALLFTVFMSAGLKKFDRYLLPVFAPLDLAAGIGLAAAIRALCRQVKTRRVRLPSPSRAAARRILGMSLLAATLGYQLFLLLRTYPYSFSYYNPLLGGLPNAANVMMIGWGEGMDQAARYLNSKPNAQELSAHTWYEGLFTYIFDGRTLQRDFNPNPLELEEADYYVLYIHQWQRQLPSREFLAFFDQLQPEYILKIDGVDYVKVYRNTARLIHRR